MPEFTELAAMSAIALAALALIVVAATAATWLIFTSATRRTFGAAALLIGFLVDTAFLERPALPLGLQIYPNDVVALLLIAALLVGSLSRPIPLQRPAFLIWLGLGAVIFMSLAAGLDRFGTAAGVEARSTFYYWVAGLYFCAQDYTEDELRRIAKWCLWAAWAVAGIALARWVGVSIGVLSSRVIEQAGAGNEFRSIGSNPAFFLAAVALVQMMAWLRASGTRLAGLHALIFSLLVVIVQHRSVWVVLAVGLVWLMVQERAHLARRAPVLVGLALFAGIALGIAAAFGLLDRVFETLLESSLSISDRRSTVTDRVFGWQALLSQWAASPPSVMLFGDPFGTGFRRVMSGVVIEYAPHNFYVSMLLRVGVAGTALFLIATLLGWLHAVRARPASEFEYGLLRGLGLVLLVSLVYFIPYQAFYLHGAATGLALALLMKRSGSRAMSSAPQPRAMVPPLHVHPRGKP